MKKLIFLLSLFICSHSFGQYIQSVADATGKTNTVLPYLPTGDYLNDNFQRASIGSSYSTTLPNATLTFPSSAHLHVTGGNNSFSNFALYNNSSAVFSPDKYMIKLGIVAQSNAANDGIGASQVSVAPANPSSFYVKIDLGTSHSAALEVYNTTSFAAPLTTITGLVFNTGDSLLLTVVRNNNNFIYSLTNLKSNTVIITAPYSYDRTASSNYEPNIAQPQINFYQGTQDVYLFEVTDLNQKNGNVVGVGDSITEGYKSTGTGNDWMSVLFNNNTNFFDRQAGVSERTTDAIKRLPRIISNHPKYVLLAIGINDGYASVSNATYQANIDTIVTTLLRQTPVITPILLAVTPSSGFNATSYNSALQTVATLRSVKYVDVYTPLVQPVGTTINPIYSSADSLHPNNAGHGIYATTVLNACPELFANYTNSSVQFNRMPAAYSMPYIIGMDSNFRSYRIPYSASSASTSITGSGTTNQLALWNGTTSVFGTSNYTVNTATPSLTIGGGTPSQNMNVVVSSGNAGYYARSTVSGGAEIYYLENDRGGFTSYGGVLYGGSTAGTVLFGTTDADKMYIFADGTSNLGMGIGTLQAQPVLFGVGNAEIARFKGSNGHLSLGTTTDNGQLTVAGVAAPEANVTRDLGTSSFAWRDVYLSHPVGKSAIGVSSSLGTNVTSITPAGSDAYFNLTVVTSGNTTGTNGLIAFGRTWGATPYCTISAANAATGTMLASAGGYVALNATSTSSMTLAGVFTGAGTWVFNCHCGQ